MFDNQMLGACFLGSTAAEPETKEDAIFKAWLYNLLHRLMDKEYCTRFVFNQLKAFEVMCIKMILCDVLTDEKIVHKIKHLDGGVDFAFIISEGSTISQNHDGEVIKKIVEELSSVPLRVPISVSPFPVPGKDQDKIYEMIDISEYMICCLPLEEQGPRHYYDYARSTGMSVFNWFDK